MEEESENTVPPAEESAVNEPAPEGPAFAETIGRKATRKILAKLEGKRPGWSGFSLMGMVGWSVAVPTIIGAFVGRWLDAAHPSEEYSWTLVFLAAGVFIGCVNAWRWVSGENAENRDVHRGAWRNSRTHAAKDEGKDGK